MIKTFKLATLTALTLSALSAHAASEPAVVYDSAGKFDKSFNEAIFRNITLSTFQRFARLGLLNEQAERRASEEQAKALGAKWDGTLKTWYIPMDMDMGKFRKWL